MQISKKEKILIVFFVFLLAGFLYYEYGYKTLINMIDIKTTQKQEIETKYNNAMSTINSMESQKSKVKILNAKINDEASPLYPTLSQEHIILEFDKLIKDSGLEGGMTFEEVEVKAVEQLKKSSHDKGLKESSIQDIADEYKYKFGDQNKEDEASKKSKDTGIQASNTDKTSSNTDSKSDSTTNEGNNSQKSKENTVTQVKFNIDFNGNYKSVVKLINSIRKNSKKVPILTINMSTKNLKEVKGSINMIVYSIPKIDDEVNTYLNWNLNNTYGKEEPFVIGSKVGIEKKTTEEANDFTVSAKSVSSELPTIMMGRANDILRTTYVYGDGNNEQKAEIVLTKENGKYFYKYKTSMGAMPEEYNGLGSEFVPNGENINIDVFSEARINSDDQAGVRLNIINNTDKLVNINIRGEDTNDPRVYIDGDSKNINVNQK